MDNAKDRFFIGIDGGGTKTEFVLFSQKGNILRRLLLGGSNPNSVGIEKCCGILREGIRILLKTVESISAIFIGCSGVASGNNSEEINTFLKKTFPNVKAVAKTDIMNVIASATDNDRCVAAICGTGSVVYAYENDRLMRFGGWGYLLDDGGSGYDIGKDALRAVLAEQDGFGEKTLLTELIETSLQGSVWENIGNIYAGGIRHIASFAPFVFEAYRKGDKVCENILKKNIHRLAKLINHAIEQYDCGNTLVLAGGITAQKDILLHFLKEKMDKELQIVIPELPQIYGACVQALKFVGLEANADFKVKFTEDYKNIK